MKSRPIFWLNTVLRRLFPTVGSPSSASASFTTSQLTTLPRKCETMVCTWFFSMAAKSPL